MRKSKKIIRGKKIKGFFYYRKQIILGMLFLTAAFLSFMLLPGKQIKYSCANSISCINDLSGTYDERNTGIFNNVQVQGPAIAANPYKTNDNNVLGADSGDNKHIYIDLTSQRLYAYDGNNLIYNFLVSTGKWNPTPKGTFKIWIKLRYTRMKGGSKDLGTYYDLPNVPYTMYFYNAQIPKTYGYGIHGAYWHNNFGHPMSHGCVNMKEEDVAQLYAWANPQSVNNVTYATNKDPGTLITIYGDTPKE